MVELLLTLPVKHAWRTGGEWLLVHTSRAEKPLQERYSSWLQKGNVHKIKFFMLFYFPVLYSIAVSIYPRGQVLNAEVYYKGDTCT